MYVYGAFTDGLVCDNGHFGDPLPGVVKSCDVVDNGTSVCSPPAPQWYCHDGNEFWPAICVAYDVCNNCIEYNCGGIIF
ncbi:MAG: hypothetical protein QM765_23135 [Myxococcales bacterium]